MCVFVCVSALFSVSHRKEFLTFVLFFLFFFNRGWKKMFCFFPLQRCSRVILPRFDHSRIPLKFLCWAKVWVCAQSLEKSQRQITQLEEDDFFWTVKRLTVSSWVSHCLSISHSCCTAWEEFKRSRLTFREGLWFSLLDENIRTTFNQIWSWGQQLLS